MKRDGDVACPKGTYATAHTRFTTANDTRGCAGCLCTPTVTACTFTGDIYGAVDSGCTNAATGVSPTAGTCAKAMNAFDWVGVHLTTTPPTTAPCASSGGSPSGAVAPATPITVCCAL